MNKYFALSKPDIYFTLQFIPVWIYLNTAFNILGLWVIKQISGVEYQALQNIFTEFVLPIVIQTAIFSFCLFTGFTFLKNRNLSILLFVLLQFVLFNIIFLLNLKTSEGIYFESTWNNIGLHYLSYNGQYFVDIVQTLFPLSGDFEGNLFKPTETFKFYFYWVILTNVYYLLLSYISLVAYRFLKR